LATQQLFIASSSARRRSPYLLAKARREDAIGCWRSNKTPTAFSRRLDLPWRPWLGTRGSTSTAFPGRNDQIETRLAWRRFRGGRVARPCRRPVAGASALARKSCGQDAADLQQRVR